MHHRIDCTLTHRNINQAVARDVERDGTTGRQRHATQLGANDALVTHIASQQRNIAAISLDGTLVENRPLAITRKTVVARHEVAV